MGRPLRALLLPALGTFVILEFMLAVAVLFWPRFEEHVESLRAMAALPVLQDIVDQIDAGGALAYVLGQQYFKACNTLGTAAAVLFAASAVAGEAHRGTLELWLSRPFSRTRILTERYVAGVLAFALPVCASSATIPWLADRVDEVIEQVPLLWCSLHQCLLLLAIYSLTFLFSASSSNPLRVALIVLFATTFEFALYMVERVTHFSLFRLTDIDDLLWVYDHRALKPALWLPLLSLSGLAYGAALFVFRRRVP
jgi:ABC-type transport system involved in multi-copper enzyme maturation permease subunit